MALTAQIILSLVHRKETLAVTIHYTDVAGEESVRTLTSIGRPEACENGGQRVSAFDIDKQAWRTFRLARLDVLSVWDVDPDGERRLVDPAKLMAQAFATRLETTLERVVGTNLFDSV